MRRICVIGRVQENIKSPNTLRNAMEAIVFCNKQVYPNVFKFLQIFTTLPVLIAPSQSSVNHLLKRSTKIFDRSRAIIFFFSKSVACVISSSRILVACASISTSTGHVSVGRLGCCEKSPWTMEPNLLRCSAREWG